MTKTITLTPKEQAKADFLDAQIKHRHGMYYDRDGNPISFGVWAVLYQRANYHHVQESQVGETRVSTVWLGMNLNWTISSEPAIFETMIFGGPLDEERWRYASEAEAITGHERALALVRMETEVEI